MKRSVLFFFLLVCVSSLTLIACGGGGVGGGGGEATRLYFNAADMNNDRELYWVDKSGTVSMIDVDATTSASPGPFGKYNGKLYFRAKSTAYGDELWMYDGVNAPTMVADINSANAGSDSSYPGEEYGSVSNDMVVMGGKFYFSAFNGTSSYLFVIDGDSAPVIATTTFIDPRYMALYDGRLFM